MRTAFEEEEEISLPDHQEDRELTISVNTLLAIFFGLVLICGLFFGLGYSFGRRASSDASSSQASALPTNSLQTAASQPKPSAASQTNTGAATPSDTETPETSGSTQPAAASQDDSTQAKDESSAPEGKPVSSTSPAPQQVKASATPPAAQMPQSSATPTGIMVQIAAIGNPADADVLVHALQKRGYSVTTRHLPSDALIHVQVGPFANKTDAVAMRQKLLGDGYNVILK
jgi:DedD protein